MPRRMSPRRVALTIAALLLRLPLGFWLSLALAIAVFINAAPADRHWYTIPGVMVIGLAANEAVIAHQRRPRTWSGNPIRRRRPWR
jgi:hypothetical protein